MIPPREQVINQILGCIYKEGTEYRLAFDNILKALVSNNYVVPNKQFEELVEVILNKKLVGMPMGQATKYAIASIIVDVADQVTIDKTDIAAFENKTT